MRMRRGYLMVLLLAGCASTDALADGWTTRDSVLLGSALTLLVVDWGQTRDLTNGDECTRWVDQQNQTSIGARKETYRCRASKESNPLLGDYPSREEVDRYFALALLGTATIAYVLPTDYRKYFLGAVIILETGVVIRNHRLGLRVDF
jgi:hypothetical protein